MYIFCNICLYIGVYKYIYIYILERELITPPLNGLILPGVTRLSLLELAREWKEFVVTERTINMAEIVEAAAEKRVKNCS